MLLSYSTLVFKFSSNMCACAFFASQSLSVRDFDDHATRVVGKYEVLVYGLNM